MSVQFVDSPFLPEHASGDRSTGDQAGYNPSDEDKELIKRVEKYYKKAKRKRAKYDEKWLDFYKMFRGKQWKELRPSYRHSEVLNLVFQTIQSMVPVLTDSRPRLEFLPQNGDDLEFADILTKVAENDWERCSWLMILVEILLDGHIYGDGFGYCGFDPKENLGLGNILFESTDNFGVFPDPNARAINDKRSKYFIYAEPVDLSQLKREYPEVAQYLQADVIDLSKGEKTDLSQVMFKSPVDSRLYIEGSSVNDNGQGNQALKITCYIKDDECIEEEVETGEGEAKKKEIIQKLKYPNGRKICIASGVLLSDEPCEFDDGKFPYVKYSNYPLPREFWSMGDVEPIEGPQKTLNKLVSFTLDVMTLMGNPIWVVGSTANIDTDNLINKPGLIVETDDPNAIRREEGVQLQPFIFGLIDRYKQYIDGISGQTDLSRGATNDQVQAASAIQSLQEAQQTRLRQKSRNVDALLQDFGRMYVSRVFQYYNVPRIVRVSGNENAAVYFNFHVENRTDENGNQRRVAIVTGLNRNEHGLPVSKEYEIRGDFDVRVTTGSSLPFAKKEKMNIALQMFDRQAIDAEELLKAADYPNYEKVLQRIQMQQAQAQEQQMIMAQQQAQMQAQAKAQGGAQQQIPQ